MTTALEGGEGSASLPGRSLPPGKSRYPLYRRIGGPQGRSGRTENLAPTGIRSPDRPAHCQSLYRLRYPAHNNCYSGKSISITYSENVFVALVIQHAMRMHRIVMWPVRLYKYFPTFSHKRNDCKKKLSNTKCVLTFSTTLV
jgi:hypothetical protein